MVITGYILISVSYVVVCVCVCLLSVFLKTSANVVGAHVDQLVCAKVLIFAFPNFHHFKKMHWRQ